MSNNPSLKTKINMFFYCLDNKKAPNGGMINSEDFYCVITDYSERSIKEVESYLSDLFDYSDVTKIFSQKQGNNSLLMVQFYLMGFILSYIKDVLSNKEVPIDIFQPENADIRDIHHILSHDAFTANDTSWFQSIQLHLPLGDTNTHIFHTGRVLKKWIDSFNTTVPIALTTEVHSFITDYIESFLAHSKKVKQTSEVLQQKTSQETKTLDEQEIAFLKKDIDQQKQQLNKQLKTINNSSLFARIFHKTQSIFSKSTPAIKFNENETSITNQINNSTDNSKHPKDSDNSLTDITETDISNHIGTKLTESNSEEKQVDNTTTSSNKDNSLQSVQVLHPILQQLLVDRNIPKYTPKDESLVLVSDYINDTENTLLREKIAEKNTSAMISLAVLKLEELQSNKEAFVIDSFEYSALAKSEKLVLKNSLKLIESAANKGNAAAQYFIYSCYKDGYIYAKDDSKAKTLLKESAKNGHKLAIKALSENLRNEFSNHTMPTQNSRINDDIILWVVGATAFVTGLLIFL